MKEKYRMESMSATVGNEKAWKVYEYEPSETGPGAYVYAGIATGRDQGDAINNFEQEKCFDENQ